MSSIKFFKSSTFGTLISFNTALVRSLARSSCSLMLALSIFVASSLARNLPTRLRASSPRRVNPSRPPPRRQPPSPSPSVRVTTSAITAALTRAIFTSLFPPSSSRAWHRSGGGARSFGRRNIVQSCSAASPRAGTRAQGRTEVVRWRTRATRIDVWSNRDGGGGRATRTRTWATEARERSWGNHHATPHRRRRRRRGRGRRSRDARQVVVVRLLKSQEPRPRRRRRRHRRRRVMRRRQQREKNSRA